MRDEASIARTLPEFDDDSRGFAAIERDFVRKLVPEFEWLRFPKPSPRNQLPVSLRDARVALIGTAGAHLPEQPAMSPRGQVRFLPSDSTAIRFTHPGFDTERAARDPEVVFPLQSLQRLVETGFIGALAPTAMSTMGFIPRGERILENLVPEAVTRLRDEDVHLALLVPA